MPASAFDATGSFNLFDTHYYEICKHHKTDILCIRREFDDVCNAINQAISVIDAGELHEYLWAG